MLIAIRPGSQDRVFFVLLEMKKSQLKLGFLAILGFVAMQLTAQLPQFDIYTCSITETASGKPTIAGVKNLTNHPGYDNQPTFSPDGKAIYFSSVRDNVQSDIYAIDITGNTTRQITNTEESEYSPVFTSDGKSFTVVRVEKDSVQRMWQFVADASSQKVIFDKIDSIGYYCRIDDKTYAFFLVTEPSSLVIADAKKQTTQKLDGDIGRCIKLIPNENSISFLVKKSETEWLIKKYNFTQNKISIICSIPAGSEDFLWVNNMLLMARENQFWIYNYASENPEWKMFSEIPQLKGKQIYRLAMAGDGVTMAFVADE